MKTAINSVPTWMMWLVMLPFALRSANDLCESHWTVSVPSRFVSLPTAKVTKELWKRDVSTNFPTQ